jgi:heavy metal sensor kinase
MSSDVSDYRGGFRTIGARLTAWGAGITFGVCLLACAALYGGVWYSLDREVDTFLEGEVREFLGVVEEHQFNFAEAQQLIRLHLGRRAKTDLTFRVLDDQGHPLLTSHVQDLIPDGYTVPTYPNDITSAAIVETLTVPGRRHPIRVCTVPARGPGGEHLLAQASYALDQVNASLSMIRTVSLIALLAAVVLSVLGGRILARRSLGPLHQMIQTARQIGNQRIAERLPRSHNGDEFDRLAETLNNLLDRTDEYVRRMQQFTADASHELRSPLAALQGSAEVALARDRSAEDLRGVIESSIDHYRRLRRISDDLLLLARIDSGEDILTRERIRLDELIDDVVDLYEPTAAEAGLQLTFAGREPIDLVGDGGRLRQVIANLIDNAIKYSKAPSHVSVSLIGVNGLAVIEIRDTGVGIPAEDLPHVFERFYRADRARTKVGSSGAGLGLTICRSIVTAHGGQITLSSKPGEGTLARLELPTAGPDAPV